MTYEYYAQILKEKQCKLGYNNPKTGQLFPKRRSFDAKLSSKVAYSQQIFSLHSTAVSHNVRPWVVNT